MNRCGNCKYMKKFEYGGDKKQTVTACSWHLYNPVSVVVLKATSAYLACMVIENELTDCETWEQNELHSDTRTE